MFVFDAVGIPACLSTEYALYANIGNERTNVESVSITAIGCGDIDVRR